MLLLVVDSARSYEYFGCFFSFKFFLRFEFRFDLRVVELVSKVACMGKFHSGLSTQTLERA